MKQSCAAGKFELDGFADFLKFEFLWLLHSLKFAPASFAGSSNLLEICLFKSCEFDFSICKFGSTSACKFDIFFAFKFISVKPSRSSNLLKFNSPASFKFEQISLRLCVKFTASPQQISPSFNLASS